jgi:hypothetical protein
MRIFGARLLPHISSSAFVSDYTLAFVLDAKL